MLLALQNGSREDIRATLTALNKFFPAGSPASECERRDLLETVGEEVIAHWTTESFRPGARVACRTLLQHLAGLERNPATELVN